MYLREDLPHLAPATLDLVVKVGLIPPDSSGTEGVGPDHVYVESPEPNLTGGTATGVLQPHMGLPSLRFQNVKVEEDEELTDEQLISLAAAVPQMLV